MGGAGAGAGCRGALGNTGGSSTGGRGDLKHTEAAEGVTIVWLVGEDGIKDRTEAEVMNEFSEEVAKLGVMLSLLSMRLLTIHLSMST